LYFTSHEERLAALVREGRRAEFAHFAAFADPARRERIPDPNAVATFEASRPQPGPDAAAWRVLYRQLLALRREKLVPRLAGARSLGASATGERAVVAQWRLGDGTRLVIGCNIGDQDLAWPEAPDPAYTLYDSRPCAE